MKKKRLSNRRSARYGDRHRSLTFEAVSHVKFGCGIDDEFEEDLEFVVQDKDLDRCVSSILCSSYSSCQDGYLRRYRAEGLFELDWSQQPRPGSCRDDAKQALILVEESEWEALQSRKHALELAIEIAGQRRKGLSAADVIEAIEVGLLRSRKHPRGARTLSDLQKKRKTPAHDLKEDIGRHRENRQEQKEESLRRFFDI